MKLFKIIMLLFFGAFAIQSASGQTQLAADPSTNLLVQNSGQVTLGGFVFVQLDVINNGPNDIQANRIRPRVSVPASIVSIAASGHVLPSGWSIQSINVTNDVITLCNGTDAIPANATRTVLINVTGTTIEGSLNCTSGLLFSNGTAANCGGTAPTLTGKGTANDVSNSSIQVSSIPAPVTLSEFSARLINCKPELHWITETEINSDRFEIENSGVNNYNWTKIGSVMSHGKSTERKVYINLLTKI